MTSLQKDDVGEWLKSMSELNGSNAKFVYGGLNKDNTEKLLQIARMAVWSLKELPRHSEGVMLEMIQETLSKIKEVVNG